MNNKPSLVDALSRSPLFHQFQEAFTDTTGLPLSLKPAESWHLPLHGTRNEGKFCALMARQSRSCAHCLQHRESLLSAGGQATCTAQCGAGISETAVPVRIGEQLLGFLHTGQVFQAQPTPAEFDRAAKLASKLGLDIDVTELRDAYFGTRVLPAEQYAAWVRLLEIFADQLSLVANQMQEQERLAEPPVITKAKQFINHNYTEDLSLPDVAKACNTSTFYFCKIFKRETGMSFTEYLSSVRIEKAKNLLLNRELQISEIGYEVGFQSLTHFNRVFKKRVGQSPSEYRNRLPGAE